MSTDDGVYGPKMKALTSRMQKFVEATFAFPGRNPTHWAREAGYSDNGGGSIRVQAHVLWHDERIQDAILEEARRRFKGLVPLAQDIIVKVMENPQSTGGERLKAAQMIVDRGGLHSVSESKVTHEHLTDDSGKVARLEALALKLGLPVEKLIGRTLALQRPAVEAEFHEIVDLEDMI